MATSNPTIPTAHASGRRLVAHDGTPICRIGRTVREATRTGWLDWLRGANHNSFAYVAAAGQRCTFVREPRKTSAGNIFLYWYAYRKIGGRVRRRYIGRSPKMTMGALESAAMALAQLDLADVPA